MRRPASRWAQMRRHFVMLGRVAAAAGKPREPVAKRRDLEAARLAGASDWTVRDWWGQGYDRETADRRATAA